MKRIVFCLMLVMMASGNAFAFTCGDFKSVALSKVQERMQTVCREVSGRNVTQAKSASIKKALEGTWDSGYTFECMKQCGDAKCVDNLVETFVRSAMNEIEPGLSAEWCRN